MAALSICLAMVVSVGAILLFKWLHDLVRERNEKWVERYTIIAGRATALFIGSFAIEMILKGIEMWIKQLSGSG
jgi:multiple antibiotic resistance protein